MATTEDSPIKVHQLYPYLRVRCAAQPIDYYARAFGARELFRLSEPGGRIGHAEIKIGEMILMVSAPS